MEEILSRLRQGDSFTVMCHAGTGKTHAALHALRALRHAEPEVRALFVEYNRELKEDARKRAEELSLQEFVEVTNYDGVVVKYYDPTAPDLDFGIALRRVLREDTRPLAPLRFDVLVVDEAQDMTEDYFRLLQKVLGDNEVVSARVVLVGDPRQTIYQWRGASSDFLTLAAARWSAFSSAPPVSLDVSRRFGSRIASFVNTVCSRALGYLWSSDVRALTEGGRVRVFRVASDADLGRLVEAYSRSVETFGTVGCLAHSTRESHTLLWRMLETAHAGGTPRVSEGASRPGVPCLSTLHTSKGREFDSVYLFLTPSSGWLARGDLVLQEDKLTLLYVGLTRAREELVVVEELERPVLRDHDVAVELVVAKETVPESVEHVSYPTRRGDLELTRLATDQKMELLQLLSVSPGPSTKCRSLELDALWPLLAVKMRSEFAKTHTVEKLRPLFDWLPRRHLGPLPYQLLFESSSGMRHRLLAEHQRTLSALPQDAHLWNWDEWLAVAGLHPALHCGHVAPPEVTQEERHLAQELYGRFFRVAAVHRAEPRRYRYDLTPGFALYSTDELLTRSGSELHVIVFEPASSPRLLDLFAALLVACTWGVELVSVHYLQSGSRYDVRVAEGAIARVETLLGRRRR